MNDDVIDAIGAMFVTDKNGDVWVRDADMDNPIVQTVVETTNQGGDLVTELEKYHLTVEMVENVYLIVPTAYVDLVD